MRPHLAYERRYGYSFVDALRAEFWWRVEHLGYYRGSDGGLFGHVRCLGYTKRKTAERRASEASLRAAAARGDTSSRERCDV